MFCHPSPLDGLLDVPFPFLEEDPNLPPFPLIFQDELIGCLDAAHATNLKTRRSITGLVVLLCFAAIAWKNCIQAVVATSSTEAEFYSSVTCGKIVGARFKGDCQSRGIQDSGFVNKYPGSSELDADIKDP